MLKRLIIFLAISAAVVFVPWWLRPITYKIYGDGFDDTEIWLLGACSILLFIVLLAAIVLITILISDYILNGKIK